MGGIRRHKEGKRQTWEGRKKGRWTRGGGVGRKRGVDRNR